jgi:hypothetical protein
MQTQFFSSFSYIASKSNFKYFYHIVGTENVICFSTKNESLSALHSNNYVTKSYHHLAKLQSKLQ